MFTAHIVAKKQDILHVCMANELLWRMTFPFGGTSSAFHHFTLATQIILRGPRKCEYLIDFITELDNIIKDSYVYCRDCFSRN